MKKILVPCDFSTPAINAYRFALDVAQQSKGTVHLLNVIELPVMHDTVLMPVLNFEEQLLKELREKAEGQFKKFRDKYKTEGVKVIFAVQFGVVSRTIHDYIEKESIDLVIMGSHGASGAREFFIGSNAEKMVRNSMVPVLVMKSYFKGPIKNIVFPNTFETEAQEDLVMKVKALQYFFKAHLHLVWINTPLNFTSDTVTHQRLEAFAKRFMLKDYSTSVFNHRDEEKGILEFASFVKGDLIAMGTHGRKGIAHLVNGSLAEDIANHNSGLVWTYALKGEPVEA
ncbi:universal stress protein [Fulvivirgaceae bacterium PWU4]|uniref:Universal stress protein n=1 Tax=Chryseosolibacter histidini TaxID=2782349 RepID=A0AAP2DHT2_9BACT|nr:universal stress protein [Chryseosolibacter histidini]MBT1695854.1 universal stress protein [Chryseosolibacter histidini]